jgi:endonuclease/exonuclease/phosphatase family metal-dependent hydrolase
MGRQGWMAILPSKRHDKRWAVRSMLWVRRDIEFEQVSAPSADLTVALLRLPDRSVLLASVYVEGANDVALSGTMRLLDDTVSTAQRCGGPRLDAVVAGDFNRHGQLWGGDEVSSRRQREADPIIDFMNRWRLESLLPRGTKTWQSATHATTIDLMLMSQELASDVLKCKIHDTEHGSDHRAIETSFDVNFPEHTTQPRLLFRNAP